MSEMMQTLVVALIVVAALAYVGRRAWRTLRPRKAAAGCDSGCGCGDASASDDWAKS
jgi:hypothetical protein